MSLELGVYSFGNTPRTPDSGYGPTAQAVRDVLEAVKLAEDVGLYFFGVGKHHTRSMPLQARAAARCQRQRAGHLERTAPTAPAAGRAHRAAAGGAAEDLARLRRQPGVRRPRGPAGKPVTVRQGPARRTRRITAFP